MDNALNVYEDLKLTYGIALTYDQMANLDRDIVWMVTEIIQGQSVLVPRLYIASNNINNYGPKITAGGDINLYAKNGFVNSGYISAGNDMQINAGTLINKQGVTVSGDDMSIYARDAVVSKSGTFISGNNMNILSEGTVISSSLTGTDVYKTGLGIQTDTVMGTSPLFISAGNINIASLGDITLLNTDILSNQEVNIVSNRDITIGSQEERDGYDFDFGRGFNRGFDVTNHGSNILSQDINIISRNDITIDSSKIMADNLARISAGNDIFVTAKNDISYTDFQFTKKGPTSKTTTREMSYHEDTVSSELNANDILIIAGNDLTLEAGKLYAKEEKVAFVENSLNILSKTYREGEVYHTSKSSFGGLIESEYRYEKDNLKIKSTEITADNIILDAKTINMEASKIKARQAEITAEILNMISSKEILYKNEFSIKGGVLTATIENKGKIEEIVVPSTIEVNGQLIFNNKDITSQLETDNLIKILSSQGNLNEDQINLIKKTANTEEWHDKTTTLSGMGALIVQIVVTYFTAGTGTALTADITNVALQAVTKAAVQTVVTQATVSLATSAITGNKPQLDLDSLARSAVAASVLVYAEGLVSDALRADNFEVTDYVKNAAVRGTFEGIRSEARGDDFKDGFVTGAAVSLVSDAALQMRKYVKDNFDYAGKDGSDVHEDIQSVGVRDDGVKLGGSSLEKTYDKNGKLIEGEKDIIAPFGGSQTEERKIFNQLYAEGSLTDHVIEHFAGPHDFISSWNYENIGKYTYLKTNNFFIDALSGVLLIPAAPFAAAPAIQDNLDFIQDYRHTVKENEKRREDAIKRYNERLNEIK
jgi:filamentous hemagglutinin